MTSSRRERIASTATPTISLADFRGVSCDYSRPTLAVREWLIHGGATDEDDQDRCRYVGSRNLAGLRIAAPPKNPRDAYRVPVWRAYRASMRGLGLLDRDNALTDDGSALAGRFATACRPKDSSGRTLLPESACLSALRYREASIIENVLGLRKKGKPAADDMSRPARRAALERELRQRGLFDDARRVDSAGGVRIEPCPHAVAHGRGTA
jgi:hypothetical protein